MKIKYFFKKFYEYFIQKIDEKKYNNAMKYLNVEEKKIFDSMKKYDKIHSLNVFYKVIDTELKTNKKYLKLALLHDCGKGNTSVINRILHKFSVKTKLKNHADIGSEKIKKIDEEVSYLIKSHHTKDFSREMSIFQRCDDES